MRDTTMNRTVKRLVMMALIVTVLAMAGCSGNVGVGMSVGVPVGNHGYISVGGNRWY
jgi:hypothetical protein